MVVIPSVNDYSIGTIDGDVVWGRLGEMLAELLK